MPETVASRPRRYFIFHYLLFRFLGLGWWHQPEEGDTRNFPGWYLYYSIVTQTVWVAGFVSLETIDPFVGEKEMDRFMFSLSFVITHNLTIIKLYLFIFRNKEIQETVRTLELDLYDYYQNNITNRNTIKITRIFSIMFVSFGWITIGNSDVYGAVQDFYWRDLVKNLNDTSERPMRSLPQPIYIPWNYQEEKSFILTFILETIGLLWTGHIVMTIDTFVGSVILHMSSQFAILGEAVVTAYDRTMTQLCEEATKTHAHEENILDQDASLLDESEEYNEKIVRAFYTDKQIESALQTTLRNCFLQHQVLIGFLGLGWWHQPEEGDTRNFPGWYLYYSIFTQIVCVAGFVSLETIDPFVGEIDMDRLMFSLAFVITHNLTIIKLYLFIARNKEIQEIVRTLELDLYDYYQNNKTNRHTIKITRIFSIMFVSFGWITIGNSDVYGAVQDFYWRDLVKNLNDTSERPMRSLPQPIYIPWNYQEDKSFILACILETMGLLWTGHILLTIDTFIGSVILLMSSQFAILGEAVVTAYDRTMTQLCEEATHANEENILDQDASLLDELEEYNEKIVRAFYTDKQIESALQTTLRNCFRQHQVLIGCVRKFASTYSYGFMTQLVSSMAAICVVMVQISQDASSLKSARLVTSLAFFSAMITQLGIQCFTGNELTLQAAQISDAVMQCKWERMPARFRPMLLMMMMRAQHPLRLNAAGFAYMDNDCFLAIIKAAYSYYAVLSQKQEI